MPGMTKYDWSLHPYSSPACVVHHPARGDGLLLPDQVDDFDFQHFRRIGHVPAFLADLPHPGNRRKQTAHLGRGGTVQGSDCLSADRSAQSGTAGGCDHLWVGHRGRLRTLVQYLLPERPWGRRCLAHDFSRIRSGRDAHRLHLSAGHGADHGASGQVRCIQDGQGHRNHRRPAGHYPRPLRPCAGAHQSDRADDPADHLLRYQQAFALQEEQQVRPRLARRGHQQRDPSAGRRQTRRIL